MDSEALRNLKTMRQVRTGPDVARRQKLRTTNSLSKMPEEIDRRQTLDDRSVARVLNKERKRFAALEASYNKSRQRILRSRERLAVTINRSRALTELRHELQQAWWREKNSTAPEAKPVAPRNLRSMEFRY